MRYKRLISVWLVVAAIGAAAQVASHAPVTLGESTPARVSPPPSAPARPTDKPVVRVNGVVLTDRDLLRAMYTIFPYAREHNGFPKAEEASIRQGALEMIIFEELVYQDAVRRKISISPEPMKKAEHDFRSQFATPDQYKEFLDVEMQGNPELVREKIRRSLMIEQVLQTEVGNRSAVSLAEAKAYYDTHAARFQVPASFNIQTISILPKDPGKVNPDQQQALRKRAEEALVQAQATKTYQDFGLLAEKLSDDDYRVNMGDHKVVKRDELPPEVIQVLETMKPGTVSGLIQVQPAYTIIRLNARNQGRKISFDEVQDSLQQELQKEKYERLRSGLAQQLRAKAKIEIV